MIPATLLAGVTRWVQAGFAVLRTVMGLARYSGGNASGSSRGGCCIAHGVSFRNPSVLRARVLAARALALVKQRTEEFKDR
ncbi:hypothetical protein MOKP122_36470 [Mycobacterium avium subsp. hominissuis]